MKRKYVLGVLLGLAVLLGTVACKSEPPAQPQTPSVDASASTSTVDTSPDQAAMDELNRAATRAASARKLVMDFNGPVFLPTDWNNAESLYTQAEQQKNTSTREGIQDSTSRYNRAAAAFEAMTPMTLAAAYDYAESELTAARNTAIDEGIEDYLPDYLQDADDTVVAAVDKYEAKDYYGAKDTAYTAFDKYDLLGYGAKVYWLSVAVVNAGAEELVPELLDEADNVGLDAVDKYLAADYDGARESATIAESMYVVLQSGLAAYSVREKISVNNLEFYDPQNITLGDDALWGASDDYSAKKFNDANGKTNAAQRYYNSALKTGWECFSAEKGADASTERQRALDLKANVAVRQDFNSAQAVYIRANTAFQSGNHEQAAGLYSESEGMFTEAARTALQKRDVAEEALNRANQRMIQSDETARNAEVVLEGGQ